MRITLIFLNVLALIIAGCAPASSGDPSPESAFLPDLGLAKELTSDTWLNTDEILRLEDMRGKVVLIDMWTFG